ncbi:MAG: J domain-containing protein [Deltaproteobacteria bacterium]|nr:J domain-containing protein [Deltaproteobacteria bacterium]
MEPTAQGVLSKTPLAHLIVYCVEKKLRGALVLRPEGNDDNAAADVVTLVDGWPAKIRIADQVEHLGRVLLELGAIDDVGFNESLMALGTGEGLQGQILLRRGRIDAATLERGLRVQLARKLGYLFSRPPGTRYAYYEGADFLQRYGGPELYPVDPTPAIVASIRANPSMPHADAAVERVAAMPLRIRPGVDLGKLDLTRSEADLIARLQQSPMTPAQIASMGVVDARTAKLLTYSLLLLKMVEPIAAQPAARPVPSTPATPSIPAAVPLTASIPAAASAPTATRAPAGDPQRRAEIVAKSQSVDDESFFEILGLAPESSADDAKNAYFALVKRWHPDRLPADLVDLKDDVARVFALMAEAYQTLTDPERRANYLAQLQHGGGTPQDQAEVARVMEAAGAFQKAEFFAGKNQLGEAEPFANKAFELEPGDADHVALWCWIQANKPDRREGARYDDLVGRLEKALSDNPKNERARFYRGMILKLAGRMGEAIRDFREIAEHNPRHTDAVREVRLYNMRHERDRRNKDEGSGSLLGKFSKRK